METRLNRPDRLTKHSVAVTILTYVRDDYVETRLNHPDRMTKHSATETILTYVRDDYVETRLNRPDRLTKHSVAVTILTSETITWKPGFRVNTKVFIPFSRRR